MDIAKEIRRLRQTREMTIRELAEKAEVAKNTILYIEQGRVSPSVEVADKVLKVLGARLSVRKN